LLARLTLTAVLLCLLLPDTSLGQGALPGQDDTGTLRRIGDILHIALPATAGATTVIKRDWDGTIQFGTIFGATVATFAGTKRIIRKDRPDASDARSFPSGHTAMSFSGSTFMLRRYGKKVGIPMMFTAGFVGFTRIKGQKHFADDVIAGAGIGVLYNLAFAKRFPERVVLKPVNFQSGGAGMQMQIDTNPQVTPPTPNAPAVERERPRFRIEFEYAALQPRSLKGRAPADTGSHLELDQDQRSFSPTARFQFDWLFSDPHELSFYWAPYETRDFTKIYDGPLLFDGVVFNAGEETISRFRYDEILARYRYRLIDNQRVDFRLGGSLSFRETTATIVQEASDLSAEVSHYEVLPLLNLRFQLYFHPKFSLISQTDAVYLSDDRYSASTQLGFNWRLNREWDFTFGYRGLWRKLENDNVSNRLRFDYYSVGIGYSF
jgi:PAP2 superfamily protein/uncharacterized protein DUF481